ncbi:MAG: hypothetical protein ABIA75_05105 [Candidatus Neomarinimicrobiota bacterium]
MKTNRIAPISLIIVSIIVLGQFTLGFESAPAVAVPLTLRWNISPLLYQISSNPVMVLVEDLPNHARYISETSYQDNNYRRFYDPAAFAQTEIALNFIKKTDARTTANGGIRYTYLQQYDLFSSLEKFHYRNYFGLIDSTNGDTHYDGPELWINFGRLIGNHILIGTNLEYSVERSLKSRYTECESIVRNTSGGGGVGFLSTNKNVFSGISLKYDNRQTTYEPYGEYSSAVVYSYSGNNVLMGAVTSKTPDKNVQINGYDIEYQLNWKKFLSSYFDIHIIANQYVRETDVELGGDKRKPIGYWSRTGNRYAATVSYKPENRLINGRFIVESRQVIDWARSLDYNAVSLENDENSINYDLLLSLRAGSDCSIYSKFEYLMRDIDYAEFIVPFNYTDILNSQYLALGLAGKSGLLTKVYMEATIGYEELDYHWDADKLQYSGVGIGVERMYSFGTAGLDAVLKIAIPSSNQSGSIQSFNLQLFILR